MALLKVVDSWKFAIGDGRGIATKCEKIETQLATLLVKGEESESINKNKDRSNDPRTSTQVEFQGRDKICYRCGLLGHFGRYPQCPARDKTCRKCPWKDHFKKVCKTKSYARQGGRDPMTMTLGPITTMHSVLQKENT